MDILKTPHQKLLEEAGAIPSTPGMVNTPQQMLMQESGVMQHFAEGGSISSQDMLAELIYNDRAPQHFAAGGQPEETSPELARLLERLYTQQIYSGELPPLPQEPVFQAQPTTLTSKARDAAAMVLGEKPADRLFGTGSEGQKTEYLPLQFINPVSASTEAFDAGPAAINQYRQGDTLGAGITAASGALGMLPFVKPFKKIIKNIKRK